ncbi:MAG: hypothetical protein EAZ50_13355 [Runella slithyformis]|nr:MAG: hypothetical protein EAY79_13390 [Runella slithyformis]TAF78693.1 MAG: hypothetical protein EAZ50_13355 [Runella slithyformis]
MLLISFDTSPKLYFLVGVLAAFMMLAWEAWQHKKQAKPAYEAVFLLSAAFLLVFMRLPTVLHNQEINIDESQVISHALTLKQYPTYWESVDGTTIGPLNIYLLIVPTWFGLAFDYTAAHLLNICCQLGFLLFFFLSIRNFYGVQIARLALLPTLFFFAFTQEPDFVHYSSEQLPILMLGACLWLFSKIYNAPQNNQFGVWYALGLVAGAVPFAKLQAVPLAGLMVLFAVIWLVVFSKKYLREKLTIGAVLLMAGLTFPLLVFGWALANNLFDDMLDFYIRGNLVYAGGRSFWQSMAAIPAFFSKIKGFQYYWLATLGLAVLAVVVSKKKWSKENGFLLIFACCQLFVSVYAATKTGNDFGHYLLLCVVPLAFLNAWLLHQIGSFNLFTYLSIGALVVFGSFNLLKFNANNYPTTRQLPQTDVAKAIQKYGKVGEYLTVWGWACRYYVETQMPEGTAENHSERCIFDHPMRHDYRKRYLADLHRTRPVVFADAVGKNSTWVQNKATQGHECFSELKTFIAQHYTYAGTTDDVRIYVRNDRFAQPINTNK